MFTGNLASQGVDGGAGRIFKGFYLRIFFVGRKAAAKHVEVQVAVAGMADAAELDALRLPDSFQLYQQLFQHIRRHDKIFHSRYRAFGCRRFRKGLAGVPHLIGVGDEDFQSSLSPADFIDGNAHIVYVVFALAVELNDHVIAIVRVGLLFVEVLFDDADDGVIHAFKARRLNAGLGKSRYEGQGAFHRRKDGQNIYGIFRQGKEL